MVKRQDIPPPSRLSDHLAGRRYPDGLPYPPPLGQLAPVLITEDDLAFLERVGRRDYAGNARWLRAQLAQLDEAIDDAASDDAENGREG